MEIVTEFHLHKEKMNVFNIKVTGNHNYFVSHQKILVHNKQNSDELSFSRTNRGLEQ
jgi:hypothetical protein